MIQSNSVKYEKLCPNGTDGITFQISFPSNPLPYYSFTPLNHPGLLSFLKHTRDNLASRPSYQFLSLPGTLITQTDIQVPNPLSSNLCSNIIFSVRLTQTYSLELQTISQPWHCQSAGMTCVFFHSP